MKRLYDLSSVRSTLRKGIDKGYWTLEDLDSPAPGSIAKNHRNLLRDQPAAEQIEAGPSPRDFTQPQKPTYDF
jgi:hypothetical protein|nr:hypothetical protein [uncultured Mediterranean phage uvMED]BAR24932.1 hypothetical protein [uncultured Mediterranean phage uvMED]BAR39226.1 hypothetical protein [uncultured Mediterranean phage uvMED]